jgi:hypothetical protein
MAEYLSERALVDGFVENLRRARTPWRCLHVSTEFYYQRGRTDVIALEADGNVIAFEAKLRNWRVALQQAYRNTCFANLSYVLLPKKTALNACRFLLEFERRRVGICYVEEDEAHILKEAHVVNPVQPWLASRAVASMIAPLQYDCPTA